MQARLSDTADLGDIGDGVAFFGHVLTRDWSNVEFSETALGKAQANPCVELRDGKPVKGKAAVAVEPEPAAEPPVTEA